MNPLKLAVRNIIGDSVNGYSRVTVSSEVFSAIMQSFRARFTKQTPIITYKGMGDEGGNGVRVFNIDGCDVYAHYVKESGKTIFLMKTVDANAHLLTLAKQREGEEKLPFDLSSFNLDVVATA